MNITSHGGKNWNCVWRAVLSCGLGFMTYDSGLTTPAAAAELEVAAGEPVEIVWTVPANVSVGEPFTAKLTVKDRYGNIVTDVDRRGFSFDVSAVGGHGDIWPKTVMPKSFVHGVADVQLIYKIAERIELLAQSAGGQSSRLEGRSAPFHVSAGKLGEIRVVSPQSARAGVPFRITLVALDAFGNQIKDFNRRTDGVFLSTGGPGVLTPSRVAAGTFVDGVAELGVTYTGAGEIEIRAKESRTGTVGKMAGRVRVAAGSPDKFQITVPSVAAVDEPFDVAITALDAYGNVVLDYDAVGTMLFLSSDGSVQISPAELSAKKFSQGVTFVKAMYARPEQITLIVTEPGTDRAGASARIEVRPGRARRLEVVAPASGEAGLAFAVKVRALDSRGNPTAAPESKLALSIVGSVRTSPLDIPPAAFLDGAAERKITYNVAEEIVLTAQDVSGGLRSEPARVLIRPGKASAVDAAAPVSVAAGSGIPATLVVLDAYRNVVTDFDRQPGGLALVRVVGPDASPAVEVPASEFVQGRATVTLNYFRAGAVRISAELASGAPSAKKIRSTSNPVEILPGALHDFNLTAPARAQAGTPFSLTLAARDAYGNVITDYSRVGGGVNIHSSGIGEVQPTQIPASGFVNGMAQVDLRTYAAERIVLTAGERFGSASGKSGQIRIDAGPLSHFLVSIAPKVFAGDPFPIRVEAQDIHYNIIRDFSVPGRIRIRTSGPGKITPGDLTSADFSDGVAVISATLTSSGMQEVLLETDDRTGQGRSNPIQVLPSTAVSYKVDVLDAVTAGEPFRVRVTAQDAYGNPVEDARSIGRPVQLTTGGSGAVTSQIIPSSVSPSLFSRGIAEGYLVYPQAGRVTIQVKGGGTRARGAVEGAAWTSQVEGMFFKTGIDRTEIFVLASGPLEYRASHPTSLGGDANALVITMPGADVIRPYEYDSLDMPGLKAAKLIADGDAGGRVSASGSGRIVLKLDASYGYSIESRANMIHLILRPGRPAEVPTLTLPSVERMGVTIPSLAAIQVMVDQGSYRDARRAVELFLAAHPGHPDAIALRSRLEKVLRVLGE